jgi:signal transduction histidine kinase
MFGLVRAINNFLSNLEGISVNYDFQVDENVVLDDIIALNCYRIVLELIQNIRKYENASELAVFLQIEASNLKITINHNGEGITNEKFLHFSEESKGIGLNSIKSRITLLNASIDFQNRKGAEIVLAVPLKNVRED